ncbi:MAG: chemotaxis protein CheD [Bacteroidales bacterium]|nr:chemotaxis protein CheD [Bacteroidales bacterium]
MYVSDSILYMVDQFKKAGIHPSEIEAGLFGGASVLNLNIQPEETVGYKNLEVAHELLNENKIRLYKEDSGGKSGRTIFFYSDKGETKIKMHKASHKVKPDSQELK